MESNSPDIIVGARKPLRRIDVFIGVFAGLWAFAVTGALTWYGIASLLRATGDIR